MSFLQYARFLGMGFVVGVFSIALRELLAWALPGDTPAYYSLSVVVVYALAMFLGFVLHRRYTFEVGSGIGRLDEAFRFLVVALIGALATWLVSVMCRYAFGFDNLFGAVSASAAFAVGGLTASLLTYALNAHIVFRIGRTDPDRASTHPAD